MISEEDLESNPGQRDSSAWASSLQAWTAPHPGLRKLCSECSHLSQVGHGTKAWLPAQSARLRRMRGEGIQHSLPAQELGPQIPLAKQGLRGSYLEAWFRVWIQDQCWPATSSWAPGTHMLYLPLSQGKRLSPPATPRHSLHHGQPLFIRRRHLIL